MTSVGGKREKRRGFVVGVEELTIYRIAGDELDPLNEMGGGHWMIDGTDGHLPATVFSGEGRNVFFHSRVGGIFGLHGHLLAAAHHFSAAGGKNLGNISTTSHL